MIVGIDKSEIWRAGWKFWQESLLQSRIGRQSLGKIPSFSGNFQSFVLRPSTDWKKSTYIMDDNLLKSKSPDLNLNHI